LPGDTRIKVTRVADVYATEAVATEIQTMLDAGLDEPIAHQLFLEAWDNRPTNRRSSLVIGVAALEVGIKEFLCKLLPAGEWFFLEAPSPPVKRILTEYLPKLATPLRLGGKVVAPPTRILKLVERAISTRNRTAHATGETIPPEALDEMLLAIKDVLWMLDYYGGARWALSHLTSSTRDELEISLADPDDL
jgi:hypothetical protein